MTSAKGAATSVNGHADGHAKPSVVVTPREKRSIDSTDDEVIPAKRPKLSERTDYSKWRLLDEKGRQTWHYLDDEQAKEWPQSDADKWFLCLPLVYFIPKPRQGVTDCLRTCQTYPLQKRPSIP